MALTPIRMFLADTTRLPLFGDNPAELVQDVALRFQQEASRLGVTLKSMFEHPLPPVHADIGLVERVLANLIGNALKHTPPGGTVRVGG